MENKSLRTFFDVYKWGFFILCIRVKVDAHSIASFLWDLFINFMYCNLVPIWVGLPTMAGRDIYFWLKKNLKNESNLRMGWAI